MAYNGASPDVFTTLISNGANVNITDNVCTSKVVNSTVTGGGVIGCVVTSCYDSLFPLYPCVIL